jgi:serine/threonine-protein kinase RsbW
MQLGHRTVVHLEFTSALEMVDLVQLVGEHVAREAGLDEDTKYWIGMALRESVINAIKHGNRSASDKHVFVDLETETQDGASELLIRVRDEGEGFDLDGVANPLSPENVLKTSGRGIFLIRNFMDRVCVQRTPTGGTEVVMTKRIQPADGDGTLANS